MSATVTGTSKFGWCLTSQHQECFVAVNHGSDYNYRISACACQCHSDQQIAQAVGAQETAVAAARAKTAPSSRESKKSGKTGSERAPRKPKVKPDCTCGCGQTTGGGLYRPGHDSKHLSLLVAQLKDDPSLTPEKVEAVAALLPSDALKAKLRKRVECPSHGLECVR